MEVVWMSLREAEGPEFLSLGSNENTFSSGDLGFLGKVTWNLLPLESKCTFERLRDFPKASKRTFLTCKKEPFLLFQRLLFTSNMFANRHVLFAREQCRSPDRVCPSQRNEAAGWET
uniref:Uncharacterized protein n=1 Tax=Micrurus carvalhoi TaxID=3147026 RepID=A0A2H6NBS0_9SAUR